MDHHHGLEYVAVHAAYVVVEAVILVYLAASIRAEAIQSAEISALGTRMAVVDGAINLRVPSEADSLLRGASRNSSRPWLAPSARRALPRAAWRTRRTS